MSPENAVRPIGRDPDAFEAFYREHLEAVQRFVARRVSSVHDAADLTAEVFVAAIEASDVTPGGVDPRVWLYAVARRVVANHLRRQARGVRAVARLQGRALLDDDAVERIAARLDDERAARRLLREVADLPRTQREVVELVAVDGLSLVEAAAVLGVSPGAARVRYHRARARLLPSAALREVTS
ncbi:RNA polymerase sigma factor [Nocardioides perillae]|uniref:RNA polymerase sigma-70 factor (ECF subfamily) n=1 Tax=Nocardioides perillae TaxID=1119534 RepID=A0A7Y9RZA5_9ACTN|nr:RNA polymerase sigma-70 factor (ECF subfamily) [Nocardioides perillae]